MGYMGGVNVKYGICGPISSLLPRYTVLPNRLRVLLVSEPGLDKAGHTLHCCYTVVTLL
jgi:hypothetical protein